MHLSTYHLSFYQHIYPSISNSMKYLVSKGLKMIKQHESRPNLLWSHYLQEPGTSPEEVAKLNLSFHTYQCNSLSSSQQSLVVGNRPTPLWTPPGVAAPLQGPGGL